MLDIKFVMCHSELTWGKKDGVRREQEQSLLKLNNSWLTELSWPWKIPSVGLLKPGTAHLGHRRWDRQIQTSIRSTYAVSFLVWCFFPSPFYLLMRVRRILFFIITTLFYIYYSSLHLLFICLWSFFLFLPGLSSLSSYVWERKKLHFHDSDLLGGNIVLFLHITILYTWYNPGIGGSLMFHLWAFKGGCDSAECTFW